MGISWRLACSCDSAFSWGQSGCAPAVCQQSESIGETATFCKGHLPSRKIKAGNAAAPTRCQQGRDCKSARQCSCCSIQCEEACCSTEADRAGCSELGEPTTTQDSMRMDPG